MNRSVLESTNTKNTAVSIDPSLVIAAKNTHDIEELRRRLDSLETLSDNSADPLYVDDLCAPFEVKSRGEKILSKLDREREARIRIERKKRVCREESKVSLSLKRKERLQKFSSCIVGLAKSWTLRRTLRIAMVLLFLYSGVSGLLNSSLGLCMINVIPGMLVVTPAYEIARDEYISKLSENQSFDLMLMESLLTANSILSVFGLIMYTVNYIWPM